MFNIPYFKEKDERVIFDFMFNHPFIVLTGVDANNKPVATQVPVLLENRNNTIFISGHIMKETDHHKVFEKNNGVLAIFTGPHTYISASLYNDQETASTWNYMSVYAKGTLRFLDEEALLKILKHTTNHFENDAESPSLFEKLPEDYVEQLAKAIVAFEIEVKEIDNVFKLSQNKDEQSYHRIINKLEQQDDNGKQIAEEMKKRTSQLFNDGVPVQRGNFET